MQGRVKQPDPMTPILVVVAAVLAFLVWSVAIMPKMREHRADEGFNSRCLKHGFTIDQCQFFRTGGEDESTPAP